METLTAILHELKNERRRDYETTMKRNDAAAEPSHRRHRNEEIPSLGGQTDGVHAYRGVVWTPREHGNEGRDQSRRGRVLGSGNRRANAKESELRQWLHVILVGFWNWKEKCGGWRM